MATYWASKDSIPTAFTEEQLSTEYTALVKIREAMKGLTIAQGAPDIAGGFEMMCALQYHYLNFMRILQKKISGEIPYDAPDERFEAVAYITRVGQLAYFSTSDFVKSALGKRDFAGLAWLNRLSPFRHKYAAHRDRDKPKKGEENSLLGELALGALGGHTFAEKYPGSLSSLHSIDPYDRQRSGAKQYECSYVVYSIFGGRENIWFIPEQQHPEIFLELSQFMECLVEIATRRPRE